MPLKLYNTLTRKKETFKPIKAKEVKIYSCGPTVYNRVHIGNLRAFIFYDLLRRYLKFRGFKVKQVMNITDVDDKTIKGSQNEKISLKDFTEKYTELFFEDLAKMNIEKFEIYPKATESINEIVELIEKLLKKGYAYKTEDGTYFNMLKFKNYGKLSNLKLNELKEGASGRVLKDEYEKQNPADFALWKFWKPEDGDVFWNTKIGKGRPGWHIECSAMSMKYLGETFDIHTGGIDLMFPHHENEIAQSEAATGKKFVNYWMHNEHLLIDGKKMSKSLGNFYTLEDLDKKKYDYSAIRYLFISTHYRQKLNFSFEGIEQAKEAIKRINDFILTVSGNEDNLEIEELIKKSEKEFIQAMDNDLNISEALAVIFNFMKHANKLGAGDKSVDFIRKIDGVLGILQDSTIPPEEIITLAEERNEARKNKDWGKSDKIRNKIKEKGYEIKDTVEGFLLNKI